MFKKLQSEMKKTAKALLDMGNVQAASAVGHMSLALGQMTDTMKGTAQSAKGVSEAVTELGKKNAWSTQTMTTEPSWLI